MCCKGFGASHPTSHIKTTPLNKTHTCIVSSTPETPTTKTNGQTIRRTIRKKSRDTKKKHKSASEMVIRSDYSTNRPSPEKASDENGCVDCCRPYTQGGRQPTYTGAPCSRINVPRRRRHPLPCLELAVEMLMSVLVTKDPEHQVRGSGGSMFEPFRHFAIVEQFAKKIRKSPCGSQPRVLHDVAGFHVDVWPLPRSRWMSPKKNFDVWNAKKKKARNTKRATPSRIHYLLCWLLVFSQLWLLRGASRYHHHPHPYHHHHHQT